MLRLNARSRSLDRMKALDTEIGSIFRSHMALQTSAGRYFREQAEDVVFLHAGISQRFLVAEPLTG